MRDVNYFRRADAASYLSTQYAIQLSPSYLAKLAVVGGGPSFHKAGRWPIYTKEALDNWASSRLGKAVSSTAEYVEAA